LNELAAIWQGFDWTVLSRMLLSVLPILLCLTIHELAHGATAYALGDDTAKRMGRLTLNPIRHVDPIGFLMLLFFRFGWAKPVPVDMGRFKNPKAGMAVTALAGPMSNFILTTLILLFQVPLIRFRMNGGEVAGIVVQLIADTAMLSVFLGMFNLLPVPPLDGSKILFSFLPNRHYYTLMRYERFGMFFLIVILLFNMTTGFLFDAVHLVFFWIEDWTEPISRLLFS